jgi:hypothetical protein
MVRKHAPLAAGAMVVQQGGNDRAAINVGRTAAVIIINIYTPRL